MVSCHPDWKSPPYVNTPDPRLITVCPGIRPLHNDDDQQRVMTPYQAIRDGADYLVVGRPIRTVSNPVQAAEAIQQEIARALQSL